MKPNRIVAVLTPLVFAPLAGTVTTWLAEHVPGLSISQDDLTAIFVAGSLIALAPALQWLHGWQKFEAREADIQRAVELANVTAIPATPAPAAPVEEFDEPAGDFDDFEGIDAMDEFDEFDDEFGEFDDEDVEVDELADEMVAEREEPAPTGI